MEAFAPEDSRPIACASVCAIRILLLMHREFFEPSVFPIRFVSIVSLVSFVSVVSVVSVVALCYPLAAKGEVFRGYLSFPNCSLECAPASRMEEGRRLYLSPSLTAPSGVHTPILQGG